jgi:hypothetical protein
MLFGELVRRRFVAYASIHDEAYIEECKGCSTAYAG